MTSRLRKHSSRYRPTIVPPVASTFFRLRGDDAPGSLGDLVPAVADISGNGHPAADQSDPAKQPTLVAGLNGHKALRFGGTDSLSLTGSVLDAARNRTTFGVWVVYSYVTAVTGQRTLVSLSAGNSLTNTRAVLYQRDGTGAFGAGGRRQDSDSGQFITGSASSVAGTSEVLGGCFDYANNDLFIYRNGTQVGTTASFQTAGSTTDQPSQAGVIGSNLAATSEFASVDIHEVIFTTAVDAITRTALADYFQATYGISMSDATDTSDPQAIPTGDLPGWTLLATEGFDTDIPLGQFRSIMGAEWDEYNTYDDTSDNGRYRLDLTATAEDSILNIRMHRVSGQPYAYVAAPTPWGGIPQLYGRYSVRWRSTGNTVNGTYKVAWLLWPYEGDPVNYPNPDPGGEFGWWANGEIDHPECTLDVGENIKGFSHDVSWPAPGGDPGNNILAWTNGNDSHLDWHISTIEWTPSRVTFLTDNQFRAQTTNVKGIPDVPMRWVLQSETELSGSVPPVGSEVNIQIDWLAVWAYTP